MYCRSISPENYSKVNLIVKGEERNKQLLQAKRKFKHRAHFPAFLPNVQLVHFSELVNSTSFAKKPLALHFQQEVLNKKR